MEGTTNVIHTGTDEFGNTVYYVMDKSSSPSKASGDDLGSSGMIDNMETQGGDGILQPVDQPTVQSTVTPPHFSTSLLPQYSNISIIPQKNAPLKPQYTKSLLPTSLLKNIAVPSTSGGDVTDRASLENPYVSHTNLQQPAALNLSQNCVLVDAPCNSTSIPQAQTSGVTNISVFSPTTCDTTPTVAPCNNGLNLDYTSVTTMAQNEMESVLQNDACVFQQSMLPQSTSQNCMTGNTVPRLQTNAVDFTQPKSTYVQQLVEDVSQDNGHQLTYSLLTPGISQPSNTLSQNASNSSVNGSQFLQVNPLSNVSSNPTMPNMMNLQPRNMASTVPDTATSIDASQLLNGLPEETLESIHSLLEAVGVDQSQLDQLSEEETDGSSEVEKFGQRLRDAQRNVTTFDTVVPDKSTRLTSEHQNQGKISLLTSSKKLNGQTSGAGLFVPQSNVKRSSSPSTLQLNVSGAPSVSDAQSSSPVGTNNTLSKIMLDLHIKPTDQEINDLEPARLNIKDTYMPESAAAKVKKSVSNYDVDFSKHPQICMCHDGEPGNEIPVEQIWKNGTQMYFLPQIAVIVISLQECVGFLRENRWHISVAEITQRLLPSLRQEFEKYLIAEDSKKDFLSFEEIGYLKQRGCIDMNTKSCTMISLQTLRRACQYLKDNVKLNPRNIVLECAAVGSFYRKIFENRMHCSRCGGIIKMIDRPDRYILLDTMSITMSEEGNQHFQSLYVRKECEDKCQQRSIFIGVIFVLNNIINGFKIDNKIFVSVKELVNLNIFTLTLLQDNLQSLQYRPRPAPSSVDLHFLNQGLDLGNTLWVDMMTVRCMCSMLKVSSLSRISKLVPRIACGQYFTKFNTELKAVDDTDHDQDTVFTLDPVSLKITTKRKQTISLCMPRNYVKSNDAIPKRYKGWRCTPEEKINIYSKKDFSSDEEAKAPPTEPARKNVAMTQGNLKPGVYCIDSKNLVKFLSSNTNISLPNDTNKQASKDQVTDNYHQEKEKEGKAFKLKKPKRPEKNMTHAQDTMDIVPIRYRKKNATQVDKNKNASKIASLVVEGSEDETSTNASTLVEKVGSPMKKQENSSQEDKMVRKLKRIHKKDKVDKSQHETVTVQKKACLSPARKKTVSYKNPVDELADAVSALEKGYEWNEQNLMGNFSEEPLQDPSIDLNLLNNSLDSQNDETVFQDRNVIVERQPVHSLGDLELTGAHHLTDLKSQEQGSREASPRPVVCYAHKVTSVQQDLQENAVLNTKNIINLKNNLGNSIVNLQSTPCKTTVSSASKSPLLSPVIWRSPNKQTVGSLEVCHESEVSETNTSPRREILFTKASQTENSMLLGKEEKNSARNIDNNVEKKSISPSGNRSVQLTERCETDVLVPSNKNILQENSLHSLNIDTVVNGADNLPANNDNVLIDKKLEQSSCMLTPNSPRVFTTPFSSPDKQRNSDVHLSRITQLYNKCASLDETLSSDQSLHVLAVVAEAFNEDSQLKTDFLQDKLQEKCQDSVEDSDNVHKLKSQASSYIKSYLRHVELDSFLCEQNQTKFKFRFRGTAGAKIKRLMARDETKKRFLSLLSKLILYTCLYNEVSEERAAPSKKQTSTSDDSYVVMSNRGVLKAKRPNSVLRRSHRKGSLKQCSKTKQLPKASITSSSGKSASRRNKFDKSKGLSVDSKPKSSLVCDDKISSPNHTTRIETAGPTENVSVIRSPNLLKTKSNDEHRDISDCVNTPSDLGSAGTVIVGEISRQSSRRKRKVQDTTAETVKRARRS